MRCTRGLGALFCLSLALASCTFTETLETTTTTVEVPPADIDLEPFAEMSQSWVCVYLDDVVAVSVPLDGRVEAPVFQRAAEVAAHLSDGNIAAEAVPAGTVLETTNPEELELDTSNGQIIDEYMGFVRLTEGHDPVAVSLYLRDVQGVAASPVHAMGLSDHYGFSPGDEPEPTPEQVPLEDLSDTGYEEGVVAVVDSGYVPNTYTGEESAEVGPQGSVSGPVVFDPGDIETLDPDTDIASHGTFVAGMIRQLAPGHAVSIARAHPTRTERLVEKPGGELPGFDPTRRSQPYVTSEIQVADAILRIIGRGHSSIDVLDLSVGGYTCDPGEEAVLVTMVEALDHWWDEHPRAPVAAPGGNEDLAMPFWPAALAEYPPDRTNLAWSLSPGPEGQDDVDEWLTASDHIRSVGAVDTGDVSVVWDDGAPIEPSADRLWVTHQAPGTDIISIGDSSAGTYTWSGSSFAAAIAAALEAGGRLTTPVGHDDVADLTYLDEEGNPRGPGLGSDPSTPVAELSG